jgi:hypothetical protein
MPQPNNAGVGCQGSPVRGAPRQGRAAGAGRRLDLDGRQRCCRRVGAARTPPREALSIRPVDAKALSDELSGLGGPGSNGEADRFPGSGDEQDQAATARQPCFAPRAVCGASSVAGADRPRGSLSAARRPRPVRQCSMSSARYEAEEALEHGVHLLRHHERAEMPRADGPGDHQPRA